MAVKSQIFIKFIINSARGRRTQMDSMRAHCCEDFFPFKLNLNFTHFLPMKL